MTKIYKSWLFAFLETFRDFKDNDGPENIFFKSGRARKFWTALIGRARQKQNKKDKSGRATYISGPSL